MFSISTKYSQNFDFRAILVNKNSNLKNLKTIFDLKIANDLKIKASKNKKGYTFVSHLKKSKFANLFFFNLEEKKNDFDYQELGGLIVEEAIKLKKNKIELSLDSLPKLFIKNSIIKNILLGMLLRNYVFKNYKTDQLSQKKIIKIVLVHPNKSLLKESILDATNVFSGVSLTRDLVTTPSNILNPSKFSNEVKKLNKFGLKIEILNEDRLKKIGMNALLGVGQGSSNKSYVAIMRWNGGKKKFKTSSFYWQGCLF